MDAKNEIKSNTGNTLVTSFGELMIRLTTLLQGIYDINLDTRNVQSGIVNMITRVPNICELMLAGIYSVNDKVSLQPTKKEIAEIVIEAISSYKKSIEELNEQNIEEIRKKIDEANKQNSKEIGVYHTQMIQMFKDLIENVNKLNNKVDRLESISQKKEVADVATQTFANGLHSSNKKVYIENILKEDLESEDNVLTNNKKLNSADITNENKNNKTPLHTSRVNDTILEDITSEKNQQSTTKRQVVVNNQNQETKKPDLKTIMKISRETTIKKYKEKVGNDYTKEQFKNNKEIGIGCKHRAFLRFDGGMTELSMDVFEKDIKLEKDTYYIEREGQK